MARRSSNARSQTDEPSRRTLAEAIEKAVTSVLSKLDQKSSQDLSDDDDDFESRRKTANKSKKRYITQYLPVLVHLDNLFFNVCFIYNDRKTDSPAPMPLPTLFRETKKAAKSSQSSAMAKFFTYDRDIICLPAAYNNFGTIKIPRGVEVREFLGKNGLIGKVCLASSMNEDELFDEIQSVFRVPMGHDPQFRFKVLQPTGGTSKSLTIPSLSASYHWTASALAGKNSKVPIYILAIDDLQVYDILFLHVLTPEIFMYEFD